MLPFIVVLDIGALLFVCVCDSVTKMFCEIVLSNLSSYLSQIYVQR